MPRLKGIIETVKHDRKRKTSYGKLTHYKRGGQIPFKAPYDMKLMPGDEVYYTRPSTPAIRSGRTMPRPWGTKTVKVIGIVGRSKVPRY
ncbi:hypothetical protein GF371_00830 [Candidatus Woesearchaeota archaeon]|nr:hypothetical protein [Candidatus Woesearchaeota archaeon]